VRVYHVSAEGDTLFDLDLDLARELADEDSEPLVNPATASSARLALAGNTLALVAGNNTYTRLGNMAHIDSGSGAGGFLVLFATERTPATGQRINGSRDLALMRLVPGFADGEPEDALDESFGSTFDVTSSGMNRTNRALFITGFQDAAPGMRHAERPKLVALGGGKFLVLFEQWAVGADNQTFEGTYAMRIDGAGDVEAGPTRVSDHHLPRGDDAFSYGGDAAWLTGNEVDRTLMLHVVSSSLDMTETVIP
jgi:hypothetical protein